MMHARNLEAAPSSMSSDFFTSSRRICLDILVPLRTPGSLHIVKTLFLCKCLKLELLGNVGHARLLGSGQDSCPKFDRTSWTYNGRASADCTEYHQPACLRALRKQVKGLCR